MTKLFKNPLFLITATIITIVFYISLSKTQQKSTSTAQRINLIEEETINLEEENEILEHKLQTSNPEQTIRNEFLMQKEGEYVVKVPVLPKEAEENKNKSKEFNLKKWVNLLVK